MLLKAKLLISLLTLGVVAGTSSGVYYLKDKYVENLIQNEGKAETEEGDFENPSIKVQSQVNSNSELQNSEGTLVEQEKKGQVSEEKEVTESNSLNISTNNEIKNFKGKLLFSLDNANENLTKVGHMFYLGNLLSNQDYQEKEKDWKEYKQGLEDEGEIYVENISVDISSAINKAKAEAYLKQENDKLRSSASSQSSTQRMTPIKLLEKYIKDNSDQFKAVFGSEVYGSLESALYKITSLSKIHN